MLLLAAVSEELGELPGEVVGIGPVVAAVNSAVLLNQRKPTRVLLVGTCGSYPGGPPIGTAVMARRVGLSYGVAAMGLGYVPRAPASVNCAPDLLTQTSLLVADVLTAGAVTTDTTLAERLSDGWGVEHLEAFGVAFACAQAGIEFNAILGVANEVGPNAHVQWLSHREAAQQAARQAAQAFLG